MKSKYTGVLPKGFKIDNSYTVTFFLKKGGYAESYRVKDTNGDTKLLKLFFYNQLDKTQLNDNSELKEIEVVRTLNHANVVHAIKEGEVVHENQRLAYTIFDFISGETLADKMSRDEVFKPYEAKQIILGVLNGLKYLHTQSRPVIHNEITNQNVMIDLSGNGNVPKIIDFGYARYIDEPFKDYLNKDLSPFYLANECFNQIFSIQTDIFSVGALYYHLVFGIPPWFIPLKGNDNEEKCEIIIKERQKSLKKVDDNSLLTEHDFLCIQKALASKAENRFKSADEFIQALHGELEVSLPLKDEKENTIKKKVVKDGQGFKAIAGMQALKEMLKLDVIDALNDKDKYLDHLLLLSFL